MTSTRTSPKPPPFRVLWPTDGSDCSAAVAPVLERLGSHIRRVRVLTVAPHQLVSGARPDLTHVARRARSQQALAEAQDVAVNAAMGLSSLDACKEPVSVWGNPISCILRQTAEFKPDLTVVGSQGQSALRFLLLGSVSSGVVQHTSYPILVVRPGHEALARVLVAYDGTPAARKTLQFLPRLLPADANVLLVRVIEPFTLPSGTPIGYRSQALKESTQLTQERRLRAERSLSTARETLEAAGMTVATEALTGDPCLELLEAAQRHSADLVAVGSRKPSKARHYLLGSTAERLVRHCAASVLVVR